MADAPMSYDLIIRNARVIDPASGMDVVGDVAVLDGVIVSGMCALHTSDCGVASGGTNELHAAQHSIVKSNPLISVSPLARVHGQWHKHTQESVDQMMHCMNSCAVNVHCVTR